MKQNFFDLLDSGWEDLMSDTYKEIYMEDIRYETNNKKKLEFLIKDKKHDNSRFSFVMFNKSFICKDGFTVYAARIYKESEAKKDYFMSNIIISLDFELDHIFVDDKPFTEVRPELTKDVVSILMEVNIKCNKDFTEIENIYLNSFSISHNYKEIFSPLVINVINSKIDELTNGQLKLN